MARCPELPNTLVRLNLGPTELRLLGLEVLVPSGLCLIVRLRNLPVALQRRVARQLRTNGGRLVVSGRLINDGRSRSRITVRSG